MDAGSAPPLPFKNCSGLTDEQFEAVALVRDITAAVCCVVMFTVVVVLLGLAKCHYRRIYGTVLKRLIFWFTASTVPYHIILAVNLRYDYHPDDLKFCEADGFLFQYLAAVGLLFALGISFVLFFKVWEVANPWKPAFVEALNLKKKTKECTFTCCGCKINKLEVVTFVLIFGLPLLFDWIPFITNSYGSTRGPICWMYSVNSHCSTNVAGLWEQIWLWNVPYGFVALVTILLFVTSFCLLMRGLRNAKFQKLIEVGFVDSLFSLAVLSLSYVWETTANYYFSFSGHNAIWLAYGLYLTDPLSSTFIPITLLFAIHFPLSSIIARLCCKYQRQVHILNGVDRATMHRSSDRIQQPSHTTWDCPHSTVDSETAPFARNQQWQKYC